MAPSRLIGAKRPPAFRAGARMAKSVSEPTMARASRMRMKKPRSGSVATACTEVSTPERTMRSEEHTSELQSLMRISNAAFCLQNKKQICKAQHDTYSTTYQIHTYRPTHTKS